MATNVAMGLIIVPIGFKSNNDDDDDDNGVTITKVTHNGFRNFR